MEKLVCECCGKTTKIAKPPMANMNHAQIECGYCGFERHVVFRNYKIVARLPL